eukprot:TRINITY_DN26875_c0_g1_i1.p1 TRINITY_DN26875_c0_g1~~TRINITY_DN26875_c0_g1_i1.p1  ORF type:complete len:190 (-),score=52.66 TRINITY_DN26875_c0_g1_i1:271-840(-)
MASRLQRAAILCAGLLGAHAANLHQLARSNDKEGLSNVDEATLKADLNKREDGTGQTPLMAACLAGAANSVEWLLEKGADPKIPEKDGYTPFHGAGFQGRAEVAQILFKHGLDPSDRHKDGYTPLHRACWGSELRHTNMVNFLIKEANVDPKEASDGGKTCLDMTRNGKTKKMIEKAIKKKGGGAKTEM